MQDDSRLNTIDSVLYESLGESLGLEDLRRIFGPVKSSDTAERAGREPRPHKNTPRGA